jgi:hypothetical protein
MPFAECMHSAKGSLYPLVPFGLLAKNLCSKNIDPSAVICDPGPEKINSSANL